MKRARKLVSRPAGFTLTEVLLALALVLVLMGSVYTAVNMYARLSTQGRDSVERLQVVRAIQHKLAVDVRSVVFRKPEEESSQEQSQAAEDELSGESVEPLVEIPDPAETAAQTFNGVEGDEKSLVLHVNRPPQFGAYTSATTGVRSVSGQGSDLISVTYLIASSDGGGLHQAVAQRTGKAGLARIVGDRLAMDTADVSGAYDTIAEGATLLAEEVLDVTFAYFDGLEWQTAWSTDQQGMMPRAIRATLTVRIGKVDPDVAPDQVPVKSYAFVIPIPLADPTPPDESASP
ncbi:MAG: prepilin-type N-terminal cleavage/methylation domain-containing protein [Planctomycetaceae bacterium]